MGVTYNSHPYGLLTYTSPSNKRTRKADGLLTYGAHNLYLNSAAPANQAITVVSGATYAITITGSVSVAASGAATGTWTAGTTTFTAATGTLTLGSTSGSGTVQLRRTPSDSLYLETAGSARYALPFEWDVSGNLEGILCEPPATNLLINSEDFTSGWYNSNSSDSGNTQVSPDGTTTADTITEDTATGGHAVVQVVGTTLTDNTFYCYSIFAKKGNRWIRPTILTKANTFIGRQFNLDTGAVGALGNSTLHGIEDWGNGWYRCWVAVDVSAGATAPQVFAYMDNGTTNSYTGDGSSTLHVWGAQLEAGSAPTSYIQTISATATRAVDNLSLSTSAYPHSDVTGTLYAEFSIPLVSTSFYNAVYLHDGTANERVLVQVNSSNQTRVLVTDGGATQADIFKTGVSANVTRKIGIAYAANDFAVSANGDAASTDSAGTLPTVTTLGLGSFAGSAALQGYLKKVAFFPRRFSNAELQALTA